MKTLSRTSLVVLWMTGFTAPSIAAAQQPGQQPAVPEPVQQVEATVERVVDRFGIGVQGGVSVDPELIVFGAHARFGPIFHPDVTFRPGFDIGVGEITTSFLINADVVYDLGGTTRGTWQPYIGAGPNIGVSHVSFEAEDEEGRGRFDFGDTDFEAGFNFIAGARRDNGLFVELRATAYGVSAVKLMAGFNF